MPKANSYQCQPLKVKYGTQEVAVPTKIGETYRLDGSLKLGK
ncbi:MAG: hypothetical protein WCO56_29500 [Verrucomicrobiota bacterium]